MDINSPYRNFEGQLTQANVSIQLTEAPDFDPLLGELSAVTPVGTLVDMNEAPFRLYSQIQASAAIAFAAQPLPNSRIELIRAIDFNL